MGACRDRSKKSVEDTVHPTDTTCIKEIADAKTDIKNNKLVYCNYVGMGGGVLRGEAEMQILLKKQNIKFKNESVSDLVISNHMDNCYCEFMQEKINEKLGSNFADSLLHIADSLWIIKNRDKVFDSGSGISGWDKPVMFPGDSTYDQTNHSGLQQAFEKLVKYPKGYRVKKGKDSMAMLQLYLDIDEKGNAKVTDTQFVFFDSRTKEQDYNKEYWDYFKSIGISLVEKTIWTPAKIKSISVKSKNDIFIYLE